MHSIDGHITVLSCGLGVGDLSGAHHVRVAGADVLAGGERLLAWFPEYSGERVVIGAHALETVDTLVEAAATRHVVVLASGDALFFGIARLFLGRVPADKLTILPNVTAAQGACARLLVPWESARFFSVHGRTAHLPWRDVLRAEVAVVYCDSTRTPASVAAALLMAYPDAGGRPAAVAVELGAATERVVQGTLASLAEDAADGMSMLVLLPPGSAARVPPLALGQEDDAFEHEGGLITHPEVRAVVLSKLRLRGGVLWDLGAGSGSVSVEAASLCAGLQVYAVERQETRCEQIRTNARAAGLRSYEVSMGEAADVLPGLPAPDAVFVGGGGSGLAAIVAAAFDALQPGGTLVVAAVLEETCAAALGALPGVAREVCRLSVSRSAPLGQGTLMRPQNAVSLFTFKKDIS